MENEGPRIRAYIDGKLVLEASDPEIVKGKAGVISATPARFQDFSVTAADVKWPRSRYAFASANRN